MKGDRRGEAWPSFSTSLREQPMDAGLLIAADSRAKTPFSAFSGTHMGWSPKMSRFRCPSTRPVRRATVTVFPVGGHEEILTSHLLPGIWGQSVSRIHEPRRLRLLRRASEIDSQNHPSAAIDVQRSPTCGFRHSGASLWSCTALPQGLGFV